MCSLALLMGSVCYSHGTIGKANGNRGGGKGNFTWLFFFFLRNGFRCSCLLPSGGASEDVHALSGICAAEPNPLRSPDPLRLDLTVSISQRQPQPHWGLLLGFWRKKHFFVVVVRWAIVTRDILWAASAMGKVKTLRAKHFLLFDTGSPKAQPGL